MTVIRNLKIYNGTNWTSSTANFGALASNVTSNTTLWGSTNLNTILTNLLPSSKFTGYVINTNSSGKLESTEISSTVLNTALNGVNSNIGDGLNSASTAVTNQNSILSKAVNQTILNMTYPVGAIYMSIDSTSPATLFGGTWTQIQDRMLMSSPFPSGLLMRKRISIGFITINSTTISYLGDFPIKIRAVYKTPANVIKYSYPGGSISTTSSSTFGQLNHQESFDYEIAASGGSVSVNPTLDLYFQPVKGDWMLQNVSNYCYNIQDQDGNYTLDTHIQYIGSNNDPSDIYGTYAIELREYLTYGTLGGNTTITLTTSQLPYIRENVGIRKWGSSGSNVVQATGNMSANSLSVNYAAGTTTNTNSSYYNERQLNMSIGQASPTSINIMPSYTVVYMWRRTG